MSTPPTSGSADTPDDAPASTPSPTPPPPSAPSAPSGSQYGGSYGPPTTPIPPPSPSAPTGSPYGGSYGAPSSAPSYGAPSTPPTPAPPSPAPTYGQTPAWPQQQGGSMPYGPQAGQQTGPGHGPYAPPPSSSPGFLGKLFDVSFSSFITPSIVTLVYIIGGGVIALGWLIFVIAGFNQGFGFGLGALIVGSLVALVYLILFRITLEFYLAVIRVAEDVRELKNERSAK